MDGWMDGFKHLSEISRDENAERIKKKSNIEENLSESDDITIATIKKSKIRNKAKMLLATSSSPICLELKYPNEKNGENRCF